MRISSVFAIAALALSLAACSTPGILAQNEPAHISTVKVSLAPNVSSQRFAELVQAKTSRAAARFGQVGAPKELRIFVERHNYKNPAMSLLVGDANYAGGRVAVVDVASGRVQGEAEAGTFDNLAINGVVGAIMAAAQDKQEVDERLADGLAKAAIRHAYGSARADSVLAQPEQAPAAAAPAPTAPEPAAAPAAKPDPASKPKATPVAGAKTDKTAMAIISAPAAR